MARFVRVDNMLLDMFLVLLHHGLVHLTKSLERKFDVIDEKVGSWESKVLANDYAHHLQCLAVRGHGVGGHNPAAFTEMVCNGELIIGVFTVRVETECDQRQAVAAALAHDDEAKVFELAGKVVGGAGKVKHDGAVASLTETNHLVVLTDNLRSTFGEVKCETSLVRSKIVDVEDQLLGKIFRGTPHNPADTRVNLYGLTTVEVKDVEDDIPNRICGQRH